MTANDLQSDREHRPEALKPIRRGADWLIYCGMVACSLANAFFGAYESNADTVVYLDLSDAIKNHLWHSVVNAYWFPLYPALLTLGRACFGFRMQYELMAARLVDAALGLFFVLAAVVLAASARRLLIARGATKDTLLPERILYLWVAVFAYIYVSADMNRIAPDALVSALMILCVAALLWAVAEDSLPAYAAVGLCGGLAYLAKAFAFPFFILWMLLAVAVNFRKPRVLRRLVLTVLVFGLIAGSYIWQISAAKGRFTYSDTGSLAMAWYVNGADQLNPVADASLYHHGTAKGELTHPGELLWKNPEIIYFSEDHSFGSTPLWNNIAYWSDGISSRFVPRENLTAIRKCFVAFGAMQGMRMQVYLFIAALCWWGFTIRKPLSIDPMLKMAFLLALASIAAYSLILLEGRYIDFAIVIMGALFAACSTTKRPGGEHRSLHAAVLLMTALVLASTIQTSNRELKALKKEGARPLQGIYSLAEISAGADLASRSAPGSEVACMGDLACRVDPYWARYAGVKVTGIIETGAAVRESNRKSAEEGCRKLEENPVGLEALRRKNIRGIVARFDGTQPCSAQWKQLGESPDFFYRPL